MISTVSKGAYQWHLAKIPQLSEGFHEIIITLRTLSDFTVGARLPFGGNDVKTIYSSEQIQD
jgi:hypothetical protein